MLCKTEMMFFRVRQSGFRGDTESYLSGWSVPSFFLCSSNKQLGAASVYDKAEMGKPYCRAEEMKFLHQQTHTVDDPKGRIETTIKTLTAFDPHIFERCKPRFRQSNLR